MIPLSTKGSYIHLRSMWGTNDNSAHSYRVTPVVTQGLGKIGLIRKITPLSRLIRQGRDTEDRPILARVPTKALKTVYVIVKNAIRLQNDSYCNGCRVISTSSLWTGAPERSGRTSRRRVTGSWWPPSCLPCWRTCGTTATWIWPMSTLLGTAWEPRSPDWLDTL